MENSIKVFNLGNLPTAPLDSFIELQEDFKKSDRRQIIEVADAYHHTWLQVFIQSMERP